MHAYDPAPSTHVAPFVHGWDAHSLIFMTHEAPEKPAAHTHDHAPSASAHVPPLAQGDDAHSLISAAQNTPV